MSPSKQGIFWKYIRIFLCRLKYQSSKRQKINKLDAQKIKWNKKNNSKISREDYEMESSSPKVIFHIFGLNWLQGPKLEAVEGAGKILLKISSFMVSIPGRSTSKVKRKNNYNHWKHTKIYMCGFSLYLQGRQKKFFIKTKYTNFGRITLKNKISQKILFCFSLNPYLCLQYLNCFAFMMPFISIVIGDK